MYWAYSLSKCKCIHTDLHQLSEPRCLSQLSAPTYVCVESFHKKEKNEFKTALMTSYTLLLIGVNIVILINITIPIDKTQYL